MEQLISSEIQAEIESGLLSLTNLSVAASKTHIAQIATSSIPKRLVQFLDQAKNVELVSYTLEAVTNLISIGESLEQNIPLERLKQINFFTVIQKFLGKSKDALFKGGGSVQGQMSWVLIIAKVFGLMKMVLQGCSREDFAQISTS